MEPRALIGLLTLRPLRDRIDHLGGGGLEGIDRVVLAPLELEDDPFDAGVLAGLIELDALPRHDELVAGDVGGDQRLAIRSVENGGRVIVPSASFPTAWMKSGEMWPAFWVMIIFGL